MQPTKETKHCCDCGVDKLVSEFHKRAASKDGLQRRCKECSKASIDAYRLEKPEVARAISNKHYERNREARLQDRREYVDKNRELVNERARAWTKANMPAVLARNARHRAEKVQRTPKWTDAEAVKVLYAKAARLSKWTNNAYHVDHIVPLRSSKVCGLHCQANLQILDGVENTKKGNRYWPDMWR